MTIRPVLLLTLLVAAAAHSFLTKPNAYNRQFRTRYCRQPECSQACPTEYNTGMDNSADEPAATWRRGDVVDIHWARNNHHGGFFRLALVPVGVMMDREWHTKLAFYHGCWASNAVMCSGNECGTDRQGVMFSRLIKIPTCFPGGSYVLGLVWYGGLRRGNKGFQDFFSCSHVRIEGGEPLARSCKAVFDPGQGEEVVNGKCLTTVNEIGVCGSEVCKKVQPYYDVPKVVKKGMESVITSELVQQVIDLPPPGVEGGRENREYEEKLGGICTGAVCCQKSCGSCGGPGCAKRKGGREGCCGSSIVRSGHKCGRYKAPCYFDKHNRRKRK